MIVPLPQAVLGAGAVGALGTAFAPSLPSAARRGLAFVAIAAAAVLTLRSVPGAGDGFLVRADALGLAWQFVALAAALPAAACIASDDEVPWALLLGSVLGASLLACAGNLLMLFIGLETMSLPAYLLVARGRGGAEDSDATEAAVKYFFAGGAASAIFLMGLAMHYADSRLMGFAAARGPLAQAGVALMGAAALFKVGVVPLHFWLPDAYEAAAPEVAGFLSTSVKASGFLLLMRVVSLAPASAFARALPALAAATMLFGAALALRQQRLQRLLAYSSIAHAGYLTLGVAAWAAQGAAPERAAALLFYLGSYALMSNGAFVFLKISGARTRADLRGFASREPALAALFAVILFALAGIPPTAGFLAKLLIFWEAIKAALYAPVACAGLAALAALGYYLGLLRAMYLEDGDAPPLARAPLSARLALAACAVPAAALGLAPWLVSGLAGVLSP